MNFAAHAEFRLSRMPMHLMFLCLRVYRTACSTFLSPTDAIERVLSSAGTNLQIISIPIELLIPVP